MSSGSSLEYLIFGSDPRRGVVQDSVCYQRMMGHLGFSGTDSLII